MDVPEAIYGTLVSSLSSTYQSALQTHSADADYFYAGNEGDILINLRSDIPGNPPYHVSVGDAVCQGIFVQYGVTDDDDATELTREQRRGGLGSTGK